MSENEVQMILVELKYLKETLTKIHEEVKKTNGRVTELEMKEARMEGIELGKAAPRMIFTGVLTGAVLAGVIWFVQAAI